MTRSEKLSKRKKKKERKMDAVVKWDEATSFWENAMPLFRFASTRKTLFLRGK